MKKSIPQIAIEWGLVLLPALGLAWPRIHYGHEAAPLEVARCIMRLPTSSADQSFYYDYYPPTEEQAYFEVLLRKKSFFIAQIPIGIDKLLIKQREISGVRFSFHSQDFNALISELKNGHGLLPEETGKMALKECLKQEDFFLRFKNDFKKKNLIPAFLLKDQGDPHASPKIFKGPKP